MSTGAHQLFLNTYFYYIDYIACANRQYLLASLLYLAE